MARSKGRKGKSGKSKGLARPASDDRVGVQSATGDESIRSRKWMRYLAVLAAIVAIPIGLGLMFVGRLDPPNVTPTFAGSESCAECHPSEAKLWNKSQHKHAMQHANA